MVSFRTYKIPTVYDKINKMLTRNNKKCMQIVQTLIIQRNLAVSSGPSLSLDINAFYNIQVRYKRTANALIRQCGCAGSCWPSLSAVPRRRLFKACFMRIIDQLLPDTRIWIKMKPINDFVHVVETVSSIHFQKKKKKNASIFIPRPNEKVCVFRVTC